MKTRIIHTKFWSDSYIAELSTDEKLLFLYYLTNSYVNIVWFYECSDRIAKFETGVTEKSLQKAKMKFMSDRKILFYRDYVFLVNSNRHESFKGEKNEVAARKTLDSIPNDVKAYITGVLDTPIDTPIDTPLRGSSNQKSVISNKKSITRNQKEKVVESELLTIRDYYNKVFNRRTESTEGFKVNYMDHWRPVHSIEKIKRAINNAYKDPYWKGIMTPTILFRRKNKNGENVDYVEDLADRGGVAKRSKTLKERIMAPDKATRKGLQDSASILDINKYKNG